MGCGGGPLIPGHWAWQGCDGTGHCRVKREGDNEHSFVCRTQGHQLLPPIRIHTRPGWNQGDGVLTQKPTEEEEMTMHGEENRILRNSIENGLSHAQKMFLQKDLHHN